MAEKTGNRPPEAASAADIEATLSQLSGHLERLVEETMQSLSGRGIDPYELAPLMKLRDTARALDSVAGGTGEKAQASAAEAAAPEERRRNMEASEELLARASAIIDVMVQSGHEPEHAAQLIARQLIAVGITLPVSGGDARGWKRLHEWRNQLIHHKRAGPAWDAYCAFRKELESIPAEERLRRAVGERLWDRRSASRTRQSA
jgi:hypothetical protein